MTGPQTARLELAGRYLGAAAVLHLVWEVAQLPLYTLWSTGTLWQGVFAIIHCTIGDVMIAGFSLLAVLGLGGRSDGLQRHSRRSWVAIVLLGMGYTIFSEWLNVSIRGSWAYAESMPTLPVIGTGLAPLLQWLVVPTLAFWFALRRAPWIEPGR